MKIIEIEAKNILTKTGIPGADWVINQYVGCQFDCLYCYAKFMCRFKPNDYGKWGAWVEAKANAVQLIKDKKIEGRVFMSSVSDPYQPVERKLELTREILKNLDKDAQLSILTKSDLVLRDIDILRQFKNVEVGLTINSFSGEDKATFEPYSPPSAERIEALKELHKSGLKTYAFISPIIPGLTSLEKIIEKCRPYADYFIFELINIRGAGREFTKFLQEKYPESYEVITDRILFRQFMDEVREIIKKSGVRTEGLHIHGS